MSLAAASCWVGLVSAQGVQFDRRGGGAARSIHGTLPRRMLPLSFCTSTGISCNSGATGMAESSDCCGIWPFAKDRRGNHFLVTLRAVRRSSRTCFRRGSWRPSFYCLFIMAFTGLQPPLRPTHLQRKPEIATPTWLDHVFRSSAAGWSGCVEAVA